MKWKNSLPKQTKKKKRRVQVIPLFQKRLEDHDRGFFKKFNDDDVPVPFKHEVKLWRAVLDIALLDALRAGVKEPFFVAGDKDLEDVCFLAHLCPRRVLNIVNVLFENKKDYFVHRVVKIKR